MDTRNKRTIKEHLQDKATKERIQQDIIRGRDEATVTISRASELFNLSESRLRDWEEAGLLTPIRPTGPTGRRLYTPTELSKLAIIRELIKAGFAPRDIPSDIYDIWHSVQAFSEGQNYATSQRESKHERMSIDHQVEDANKEEFWRYFASQVLRMALNLICENIPDPVAGIILPVKRKEIATLELEPQNLEQLGECLIGWRDENRSYHTFYDASPFFDVPSDFRVQGLRALGEQEPKDSTFVVLQRKTKPLFLSLPIVETIRRLLVPIYEDVNVWQPYFNQGRRDVVYPTTSFGNTSTSDSVLTSLADMVMRLGEKNADSKDRWKFCCILLPRDTLLPLQTRTLVVQAQSKGSPHIIGRTDVSPGAPDPTILSLSLRAFQSGYIIYRSFVSNEDKTIVYREEESPIASAIAMPIAGEDGLPAGILYLVSEERDAFNREYQRVLGLIGRMIGELLATTRIRLQSEGRLRDVIVRPKVVDRTLAGFDAESRFTRDVDALLATILEEGKQATDKSTSFISIDIDNQTDIASRYGDQASRNLSKALGDRIKGQAGQLFDKQTDCKIYYIYADRYYLMLNNTSLKDAREYAEKLRVALGGNYSVSIMPPSTDLPRSKIELKNVTVRLGVSSYKHTKFYELLQRFPLETRIADVRAGNVLYFLDFALARAKEKGGNCIFSYYSPNPPAYEHSRFDLWTPSE